MTTTATPTTTMATKAGQAVGTHPKTEAADLVGEETAACHADALEPT